MAKRKAVTEKQREKALKPFVVRFRRIIEHTAEVEIDAVDAVAAEAEARKLVDKANPYSNYWREGDVQEEYKPKVIAQPLRTWKGDNR